MPSKVKPREKTRTNQAGTVIPQMRHDVLKRAAPASAASRHRIDPKQSTSRPGNHARHHVARNAQA